MAEDRFGQSGLFYSAGVETAPAKRNGRRANDLDGATWLRNSISVWDDIRKTSEEIALKHPAIFPAQLASRLIQCFTTAEQRVVFDPFAGIGSTIIAAEALGKIGIGTELSAEFTEKAKARPMPLLEPGISAGERRLHNADAMDLLQFVDADSVDLVVTSPPYWDILLQDRSADYKSTRNYGSQNRDLGRVSDYQQFLDELTLVFEKVLVALKPGAYCCVVVMDIRKKNRFYPFHSDLAARLTQIGFKLDDIIIWMRGHEYNNLRPLGHPAVFRINKVHEYINIFQKPA